MDDLQRQRGGVARQRAVPEQSGAARPAPAGEANWKYYPQLDRALVTENPPVVAKLRRTCAELERIARSGSEAEQERARTAVAACSRALDLFNRLVALRDQAAGAD